MSTSVKRTILVTGAGSGFGKAASVELAKRGHAVIATTETTAQAEELQAAAPSLTTMKLDVTLAGDVEQVAGLGVEVLINNAGMGVMGPMATVPMEKVRAVFEVNVFGMIAMSQAVIPGMKDRGWGRIINVSSVAGILASPLTSPYAMTKTRCRGVHQEPPRRARTSRDRRHEGQPRPVQHRIQRSNGRWHH